eukprot:TRINITY_DN10564_c0_g1_i1.p1 TRINITY_DN10564_c0_g1~~TRINITY_DN10564_c0_g1_i1.p1  ORF type:complete len:530 (-),score=105.94 TRINITY_DN10564_c0_g1_i1:403-1992(-)
MAADLRAAVDQADWELFYNEGKTKFKVEKNWVASEERCEVLRRLIQKYKATRVLEVGACCGLASLSMAEVLPEGGEVVALEIDPFLAEFGQTFLDTSKHGRKVKYMVGPAMESLKTIARDCFDGKMKPFDFLMIDADRAGMVDYFNLFWWESPNMLGDRATVCIDITPYKGNAPVLTSGPSSGDLQGDLWVVPSGQDQIDSVRRTLEASADHSVYIVADLLVSHSRDKNRDASDSHISTPRPSHAGGPFKPRLRSMSGVSSTSTSPSLTHGANPLASFPNEHVKAMCGARWVPPQASDPVAQLRRKVQDADWSKLFQDGRTLTRVEPGWMTSEERCAVLRRLVEDAGARRVLEIGGFCGVAALSVAEKLPGDGQLVSLELDPFLVEFGKSIRMKSSAGQKISCMVGPAKQSIETLVEQAKAGSVEPFDFVIIDADRAGMNEYFDAVWDSPGLLSAGATVCVDINLYKGQAPVPFVRHGKAPDAGQWVLPSGQDDVITLREKLEKSSRFAHYKISGMLVVKSSGLQDIAI